MGKLKQFVDWDTYFRTDEADQTKDGPTNYPHCGHDLSGLEHSHDVFLAPLDLEHRYLLPVTQAT